MRGAFAFLRFSVISIQRGGGWTGPKYVTSKRVRESQKFQRGARSLANDSVRVRYVSP